MANEIVVAAGLPGVGKTTVLEYVMELLNNKGKNYTLINFGDVMFEIAHSLGYVKDRDEMRKLEPNVQKEIQKKAAKKISSIALEKNVIVDTHLSVKTPKGYFPGLPIWVLENLNPTKIIIIDADPKEILKRRMKDTSRKRDEDNIESIKEHQHINMILAGAYSLFNASFISVIHNKEDSILETAKEFINLLE